MNEIQGLGPVEPKPSRNPNVGYIIAAVILLAVIAVAVVLLITQGIPALTGKKDPTATAETEGISASTPVPTQRPTNTPLPTATPLSLVMSDTDTPTFGFDGAGARPGADWTGFFGQVLDANGSPVAGVPVIIWNDKAQPFSSPALTDANGSYEIRLAEAPLAGAWTIQLLTEDGGPASKLFTFNTDTNTETGIQQIQVMWRQIP